MFLIHWSAFPTAFRDTPASGFSIKRGIRKTCGAPTDQSKVKQDKSKVDASEFSCPFRWRRHFVKLAETAIVPAIPQMPQA